MQSTFLFLLVTHIGILSLLVDGLILTSREFTDDVDSLVSLEVSLAILSHFELFLTLSRALEADG